MQEKQWNARLARRFALAIPREIPRSQHADLIRDYCREVFVSKGMIADFAIQDKGDGNPTSIFGDAADKLKRMEDLEMARKELEKAKGEKPVSQKMFRAI